MARRVRRPAAPSCLVVLILPLPLRHARGSATGRSHCPLAPQGHKNNPGEDGDRENRDMLRFRRRPSRRPPGARRRGRPRPAPRHHPNGFGCVRKGEGAEAPSRLRPPSGRRATPGQGRERRACFARQDGGRATQARAARQDPHAASHEPPSEPPRPAFGHPLPQGEGDKGKARPTTSPLPAGRGGGGEGYPLPWRFLRHSVTPLRPPQGPAGYGGQVRILQSDGAAPSRSRLGYPSYPVTALCGPLPSTPHSALRTPHSVLFPVPVPCFEIRAAHTSSGPILDTASPLLT